MQPLDPGADMKKPRRTVGFDCVLIDVAVRQIIAKQPHAGLALTQSVSRLLPLFQQSGEKERTGDGDRQEGVEQEKRLINRRAYERAGAKAGPDHCKERNDGGAGGGAAHAEAKRRPQDQRKQNILEGRAAEEDEEADSDGRRDQRNRFKLGSGVLATRARLPPGKQQRGRHERARGIAHPPGDPAIAEL